MQFAAETLAVELLQSRVLSSMNSPWHLEPWKAQVPGQHCTLANCCLRLPANVAPTGPVTAMIRVAVTNCPYTLAHDNAVATVLPF